MTQTITRKCAREGCDEHFTLEYRAGKDTDRRKARRKRSLHKGRRYCSDNCRKRASEGRSQSSAQPSANKRKIAPGKRFDTDVFSTVRDVSSAATISKTYEGQKSGRAPLEMTFGGYSVIPDPEWPKMFRVRLPDGSCTDMVNLTRARDAAQLLFEQSQRKELE
jgi:hypothetical protein